MAKAGDRRIDTVYAEHNNERDTPIDAHYACNSLKEHYNAGRPPTTTVCDNDCAMRSKKREVYQRREIL